MKQIAFFCCIATHLFPTLLYTLQFESNYGVFVLRKIYYFFKLTYKLSYKQFDPYLKYVIKSLMSLFRVNLLELLVVHFVACQLRVSNTYARLSSDAIAMQTRRKCDVCFS